MLEVEFAVAKVRKYAMRTSGDTLEMIERPHGGISLVLADGQRSGRSAKTISNVVVRKAIQLLGEGVRDGAAARAAHDYLYTYRGGKVSATLNIISIDSRTQTLVVSRNNPAPVLVYTTEQNVYLLDAASECVGVRQNTKPIISEIPLAAGVIVVAATDGLFHAGSSGGTISYDPVATFQGLIARGTRSAQTIANTLLDEAIDMYNGRPRDDISILTVAVKENLDESIVRRLSGRLAV